MQNELTAALRLMSLILLFLMGTVCVSGCGQAGGPLAGGKGGGGGQAPVPPIPVLLGGCFYQAELGDFSDDPLWGGKTRAPGSAISPNARGELCSLVTQEDCRVVSGGKAERFEPAGCPEGWMARCPVQGEQSRETRLYRDQLTASIAGGEAAQRAAFTAGCKARGSLVQFH